MSIEMVDAIQDAITFLHSRPRPQGDGIAPFPVAKYGVRLMRITPRRASVDKSLELARNIGPIRGRDADDHIRVVQFFHYSIYIIVLNTGRRRVATAASFAEGERIIVNTEGRYGMPVAEIFRDDLDDLGRRSGSDRTAIDDKSVHSDTSLEFFEKYSLNKKSHVIGETGSRIGVFLGRM
jgi:hypothetical protein